MGEANNGCTKIKPKTATINSTSGHKVVAGQGKIQVLSSPVNLTLRSNLCAMI
jgi:hypothetical protein